MEQILRNKLKKDEELLWFGMPEEFTFMDATHAAAYKKKWLKVTIGCVLVLLAYFYLIVSLGAAFSLLIPGFVVLALAYGFCSDYMESKKLANKTIYGVTDRRIMVVMGVSLSSAEWRFVPDYSFETDADGHISLMCGPWPKEEGQHQRRSATVRGVYTDANSGECRSAVMYAISKEDKKALEKILAEKVGK